MTDPTRRWLRRLRAAREHLPEPAPVVEGQLVRMAGLTLEAVGCHAAIGSRCRVEAPGHEPVACEVVGFSDERTYLMAIGDTHGLVPGARVVPTRDRLEVPVGEALLGRVIDAAGQPLDGRGPLRVRHHQPLQAEPINPLVRAPVDTPLDVGVRAINGLLSVGRGQRMGLMAGSGVGKSALLGMMTRYTAADVVVVGLIGERGREVNEFVADILGPEGRRRAVVVAVPADQPPLQRLHGALVATSIAEWFRDQGRHVLLLVDSLTRYAQAQREIALAVGEPPATRGYPPSVFARLPQLVERAGNAAAHAGTITAFYTVLAEGDDQNDPVVDAARAVLDGHIVLSRELAESGHYSAIDIERSISRVMPHITDPRHRHAAQRFRHLHGLYAQHRDLIHVGMYQRGSNPELDTALDLRPALLDYLRQDLHEAVDFATSVSDLQRLVAITEPAP